MAQGLATMALLDLFSGILSWWIIHTQPTETAGRLGSPQIPPTRLVDYSYSAYRNSWQARLPPNPTNAVGGLFILSLQKQLAGSAPPNPTNAVGGLFILSLQKQLA